MRKIWIIHRNYKNNILEGRKMASAFIIVGIKQPEYATNKANCKRGKCSSVCFN